MNYPMNRIRVPLTAAVLATSIGLVGCGNDPEPTEPTAEPQTSEVEAVRRPLPGADRREGPPVNMITGPETEKLPSGVDSRHQVVPDVDGQLETDGDGLQLFLDGTSDAAFRDTLAQVASGTSEAQYRDLERSIRFLVAYDPAVLGSPQRLRETVDGMTGEDVIARADELARARYGNNPNRRPEGQ